MGQNLPRRLTEGVAVLIDRWHRVAAELLGGC